MAKIISLAKNYEEAVHSACRQITSGGLLVYPTDTLYGLGCDANNPTAVQRLKALKGRDSAKPLSIALSDLNSIGKICEITKEQEAILGKFLPGPYTFVLRLKKRMPVSESLEVGIRVPEHNFVLEVAQKAHAPIVSTSANLSGQASPASFQEVHESILGGVELAVDGGRCKYAKPSTVIDLIRMKVLRPGAVRKGDDLGIFGANPPL